MSKKPQEKASKKKQKLFILNNRLSPLAIGWNQPDPDINTNYDVFRFKKIKKLNTLFQNLSSIYVKTPAEFAQKTKKFCFKHYVDLNFNLRHVIKLGEVYYFEYKNVPVIVKQVYDNVVGDLKYAKIINDLILNNYCFNLSLTYAYFPCLECIQTSYHSKVPCVSIFIESFNSPWNKDIMKIIDKTSELEFMSIVVQIFATLVVLHKNNIIHRDLYYRNIVWDANKRYKNKFLEYKFNNKSYFVPLVSVNPIIIDFDIAQIFDLNRKYYPSKSQFQRKKTYINPYEDFIDDVMMVIRLLYALSKTGEKYTDKWMKQEHCHLNKYKQNAAYKAFLFFYKELLKLLKKEGITDVKTTSIFWSMKNLKI